MWLADMYLDPSWINQNWPVDPRVVVPMRFQSYPKAEIQLLVYGDDFDIKHIRLKTGFQTKEEIEKFIHEKRASIMNSVTVFSGLVSGRLARFSCFLGGMKDIVSFSKGEGPPLQMTETSSPAGTFDYAGFGKGVSHQFLGFQPYCFYLKMASDLLLPLDYRWLNFYRILETRYNPSGKRDGLKHNIGFQDSLKKLGSIELGTIQEIRGSIHAFARGGSPGIGQYESKYPQKMVTSLPHMHSLAIEAINTHPDNPGLVLYVR